MVGRKHPRPSASATVPAPSRQPSPTCSALSSDWDADDEDTMSTGDPYARYPPSRPLSVAVPTAADAPYYPPRPTLAEILANTAHPPWTLSAFMAFLSQNHCLETLEFTMDAARYRREYDDMPLGAAIGAPHGRAEYVQMLWQRLLDAYIVPNGPREINLPADVRDQLLSSPAAAGPPAPAALQPAVSIIYELMDGSVLVPFLNSLGGPPSARARPAHWGLADRDEAEWTDGSRDEHVPTGRRSHHQHHHPEASPPPSLESVAAAAAAHGAPPAHHAYASSRIHLGLGLGRSARPTIGHGGSGFSSGSGVGVGVGAGAAAGGAVVSSVSADNLTDDSGSVSSPGREPVTPPMTPPTSDVAGGHSPRGRSDRTWKKMTDKLGWRKKSSSMLRGSRHSSVEDDGNMS
ncbi:MAG: hypothetical protein M1826_000863 [Phylliscum demangeonii]|nr:MAG: hypothetical protein M1826_000863 [Phylliscum demangeonii]